MKKTKRRSLTYSNNHEFRRPNPTLVKLLKLTLTVLWVAIQVPSFAIQDTLKFEHITSAQGLSQGSGNCILKDSKGFMWFGTALGLNRYDGREIRIFRNVRGDSTSIDHNYITSLFEDEDGALWVSTLGGINKYNPSTESFQRIKFDSQGRLVRITSAFSIDSTHLYFGTETTGIIRLDTRSNSTKILKATLPAGVTEQKDVSNVRSFFSFDGNHYAVSMKSIAKLGTQGSVDVIPWDKQHEDHELSIVMKDRYGKLWATTGAGLARLEITDHCSLTYPLKELTGIPIFDIAEDRHGNLWLATVGKGLAVVNKARTKVQFYRKKISDFRSINNDALSTIYIDDRGIIWIGGFGGGINKYDPAINRFSNYRDEYSDNLTGILEDQQGRIWFVNSSTGPTRYNPATGERRNYHQANVFHYSLCEDDEGNLWTTLPSKGITKFSEARQRFEPVVSAQVGHSIIKGADGKLYMPLSGQGLASFDPVDHTLQLLDSNHTATPIYFLVNGKNTNIWIVGTLGRIFDYDLETGAFKKYIFSHEGSELTDRIAGMCEDREGNLWLAYSERGLFLVDGKTKQIKRKYDLSNGLPNLDFISLLEDNHGNLWIGTNNGLATLDPETGQTRTYTTHDGLVANEFNSLACFKNPDGRLYFGGMEGFNYFLPEDLMENNDAPPVVLTSLRLFNRTVPIGQSGDSTAFHLPSSIAELDKLDLRYDQNVVTFEFAALNYSLPQSTEYACKLEGFDSDWINFGNDNSATYSKLQPGHYTFRVKAKSSSGRWSENGASIAVVIHPPLWKTWWAYGLYVILVVVVLYAAWRYFTHREILKQQLRIHAMESQKLKEVDEMKTRFYTNVSHEFRTPLTLILGPLEAATSLSIQSGHQQVVHNLAIVKRNAERLLELMNQLMDFSKLESGNMKLNASEDDLIVFTRTCTAAFSSLAASKGVNLRFTSRCHKLTVRFDRDKMEKILNNLLSNALKFTNEGGTVDVVVAHTNDGVALEVRDDGMGIPQDKVDQIFDRYYQVDNTARTNEGTGIGLALLKELVLLHNGKIDVTSSEGKGSRFIIRFPMEVLGRVLNDDSSQTTIIASGSKLIENLPVPGPMIADDSSTSDTKAVILIIEDNNEVRAYIRSAFGSNYEIVEAENGEDGLATAEAIIPDLIISDIMMPRMDGQQLCLQLKTNEKTSHIPVILLTAKASQEERLQGLETGADDYLTKPFHVKELQVRVKNLIEQRNNLRRRFTQTMLLQPKEVAVTSADETFLRKCMQSVEANMSNPDFTVDAFGRDVGMSRSQLHRKLTALTGQSASEFIRSLRLKRAEELIRKQYGHTAEVAYQVGFNSVSYFIKCFKEVYGKTPTELGAMSRDEMVNH